MTAYAGAPCTSAADHCLHPPAALPCTAQMLSLLLSRHRGLGCVSGVEVGPTCTGSNEVLFLLATISSRTCCQQRSGAPSASSSTHWLLLALPCCAEHLPLPRCLGHVRAAAASLKGRFRVRHVGRVDEIPVYKRCLAELCCVPCLLSLCVRVSV